MNRVFDWLDARLGYRHYVGMMQRRVLPSGPDWWSTSASCVMWLLLIECVTGLLMMSTYSPSMASAWASVNFIDQSAAGRFLRGIHHYSSHALIIMLGLHLLRVLITGAYRAPRELVWITGLLLVPVVLVWTVTGNPLAASQKGIAQIQVEGNILSSMPFAGPWMQHLLFGGHDVGNLTLTHLYFLHVALLPLVVGGLGLIHLHQVIKHSHYRLPLAADQPTPPEFVPYWPHQSIRNITVLSVIVGVISVISWQWGAPLPAPADPELPFSPRPEWYFRWLFELRRHFTGNTEFVATLVVPMTFLFLLMLVPFLDRLRSRRIHQVCRLTIVTGCVVGWGWLTFLSFHRDWNDREYLASCAEFERWSQRARELAQTEPIPATGAIELLRHDNVTQGPRIFARHCSSCHAMTDADGLGIAAAEASAPNLHGFGTVPWILGMLNVERISSDGYFGHTAFRDGDMKQHLQSLMDEVGQAGFDEKIKDVAIALAAEAGQESRDSAAAVSGRKLMLGELGCIECHRFENQGELGSAPDLTGYGSADWLKGMISNPRAERYYGDHNDRMPSFFADASHPDLNLLNRLELELLVEWLTIAPGPTVHEVPNAEGAKQEPSTSVKATPTLAIKTQAVTAP